VIVRLSRWNATVAPRRCNVERLVLHRVRLGRL
jgi:hypothetical protein